jgi:iron(III) transport system substrate-binding protein
MWIAAAPAAAQEITWEQEWDRTLAAAKHEGEVTVYGQSRHPVSAAIRAFEKFYPKIKLNFVGGPGSELGSRVMAEKRAGKHLVDIAVGGSATAVQIYHKADLLAPLSPAFILPEVRDERAWWSKKHLYSDPETGEVFIMQGDATTRMGAYNTELVKAGEITSWWDLLNHKWRGKIVMTSPKAVGNIQSWLFLYVSPELGPKFITQLVTEADVAFSSSERQMMDWLATGKYPVHLMAKPDDVEKAQAQGLPVELLFSEKEAGSISSGSGHLSIFKEPPHPNAAKVYVNWMLSKQGQLSWQETTNDNSLRMDIPKTMLNSNEVPREGKPYLISSQHQEAVKPLRQLIKKLMP